MAEYYVTGVNHIDMAFVMREEAQAEFLDIMLERVLGVMDRNKEVSFALEQAAHYRGLETRRPDLFRAVRKYLQEGRLEFMGGMATTAETNFPNGECLVRNQGMGLQWIEKQFGVRPQSGWLVDTFGINAQIPQIMKQFGMKHLYANRFGGDKRFDLFWDEGLDGSKVMVIGKDLASRNVLPESQAFVLCRGYSDVDRLFQNADQLKGDLPKLVVYYLENEEVYSEYYLKCVKERENREDVWKLASYRDYDAALDRIEKELPVLKGDLNPEFTGTYALRTPIRIENRKAETALIEAELWAVLFDGEKKERLDECWWEIFFCQFHDVFSGSHEDITYQRVLARYKKIQETAAEVLRESLRLSDDKKAIVCCSSLPWARKEWVKAELLKAGDNFRIADQGVLVPTVKKDDGVYFLADLPAGGIKQYEFLEVPEEEICNQSGKCMQSGQEIQTESHKKLKPLLNKEIKNEYFHLVLDERNGIEKLEDSAGICYMKNADDFLTAEEDTGGLQIEECSGNIIYALTGRVELKNAVKNEMEERIEMSGTFPVMPWNKGKNRLSWQAEFSLRSGEKGLRIRLTLNWEGERTRIRLRIPGCMEGRDAFYEIPFGVVRREAYKNRPTAKGEWPAHRFAALENGTAGIALINRGTAGVEQEGGALATTLIRAYGDSDGVWIKPSPLTSQYGKQSFDFMVVPYTGDYKSAGILRTAQEFNQPVRVWHGASPCSDRDRSWFEIGEKNLVLSGIKMAWDDSGETVIRIYESEGKQTRSLIRIDGLTNAYESDLSEAKKGELDCENGGIWLEFSPFEIKTVRITRTVMADHNK